LLDYARAWREVLLRCPGTISHLDFGGAGAQGLLQHAEQVLEVLARAGFSDDEGLQTFNFLGRMVFGWVYWELEYEAAARAGFQGDLLSVRGRGFLSPLSRPFRDFSVEIASRPRHEIPILQRLGWSARLSDESFDEYVRCLLTGIEVGRERVQSRKSRKSRSEARPRQARQIVPDGGQPLVGRGSS